MGYEGVGSLWPTGLEVSVSYPVAAPSCLADDLVSFCDILPTTFRPIFSSLGQKQSCHWPFAALCCADTQSGRSIFVARHDLEIWSSCVQYNLCDTLMHGFGRLPKNSVDANYNTLTAVNRFPLNFFGIWFCLTQRFSCPNCIVVEVKQLIIT